MSEAASAEAATCGRRSAELPPGAVDDAGMVEVSFVMPCLNEAETVAACVREAMDCIEENGLRGEVVIADNGSTDGSQDLARAAGARVVDVPAPGYGSALMGGFDGARGRYLIMGDSDMSYDFREAIAMVEQMRAGADLVMGSRLEGTIEPGAMPWLHRRLGNPVLSGLGRLFFGSRVSDFHCGMRGVTKDAYEHLQLRTTGMEFASEMVVKATARGMRVTEVPITLRPDGRSRAPHLRTWRDGWRHLQFMMILSPRWTLFLPGAVMFLLGLVPLVVLSFGSFRVGQATLDIHTMIVAALLVIVGYQAMTIAIAVRVYAVAAELGPSRQRLERMSRIFMPPRGIVSGALATLVGLIFIAVEAIGWAVDGFGPLTGTASLRAVILGATLAAVGVQTVLMSFVYGMMAIPRQQTGTSGAT